MVQPHHVVDGSVIFAAAESTVTHFFVGSLLFLYLAKAREKKKLVFFAVEHSQFLLNSVT